MTPSKRDSARISGWLTIGSLARATGIPASTLRTWERRYGVLAPRRKASGHRLYPVASVRHLRALRRALDLGRKPAEVMLLPVEALERMADASWLASDPEVSRPAGRRESRSPRRGSAGDGPPARPAPPDPPDPEVAALLAAAARFDRPALHRLLAEAWTRLGPIGSLELVVAPFLRDIGEAWAAGTLSVRHEHFASAATADFLREARRPFEERAGGPWIAVATLEGDRHELGLLAAALIASLQGWRVAYLGADAPTREIAAFARDVGVRAVAVSVSAGRRRAASALLPGLRRDLPRDVELWIGGEGAPAPPFDSAGIVRIADLASLASRLRP